MFGYVANDPVNFTDPTGKIIGVDDIGAAVVGIGAVGVVVGVTNGVVTYNNTGSLSAAVSATKSGFVSGVLSAGAAVLTEGASTFAALGLATGIDLGIGFLNAPASLPPNSGQNFMNGINSLTHPKTNSCPGQ